MKETKYKESKVSAFDATVFTEELYKKYDPRAVEQIREYVLKSVETLLRPEAVEIERVAPFLATFTDEQKQVLKDGYMKTDGTTTVYCIPWIFEERGSNLYMLHSSREINNAIEGVLESSFSRLATLQNER